MKNTIDDIDRALLDLLLENARASTAALARELGLSRSTVQDRIMRLEKRGIIRAYRVELGEEFERGQLSAQVMISVDPKLSARVVQALKHIRAVKALYTVNGVHDLMAMVRCHSTQELDQALDAIGELEGIERTASSIILSTKFER